MSDSESEEFEFGDEVPKSTKKENEQLVSLADKIRKIPKKRALPPQASQDDDLSEGEIESETPSSDESDFEDYEDDEQEKDHKLRKKDKLESDDFEVPLSSLKKKGSSSAKTKSKTSSSSSIKKKKSSKSLEKTPKKKSSTSSSKSSLKTPSKKTTKTSSSKSSSTKKTSSSSSSKKKTLTKRIVSVSSKSSSSNQLITASSELYEKCDKGKVIKELLCRWWYTIEWPKPENLPDKPAENYDALDGFPGVYICTSGHEVGHISDVRDKDTCPNFKNFSMKSAKELIDLLIDAIMKQKEILIKLEGNNTQTEKDLVALNKWALRLKPEKVDKDANKIITAYKASIYVK